MTQLVNVKDSNYTVYIGRGSKWGNPFYIGRDGTRKEVIAKYRQWIKTQPELLASLDELRNQVMGCHCRPSACHGDVLIELLNQTQELDLL